MKDRLIENKDGIAGSLLLLSIILLLGSGLVWAKLTEIDEVTRAQGRVVPSNSLQVIQTLEGGVIEEIRVSRGEQVSRGDVLMVLGGNLFEGSYAQSLQRQHILTITRERLVAEIELREPVFSQLHHEVAPETVSTQMQLYESRRQRLASELSMLDLQHFQRQKELEQRERTKTLSERSIELVEEEIGILEPLVARDLEPDIQLLRIQRELAELQGDRDQAVSDMQRLSSAIEEVEDRKKVAQQEFHSRALEDLSRVNSELAELEEMLPARAGQIERSVIRSPVDGVVNRIRVNTIGGVARAGSELVEIVPLEEALVVEARVNPKDIGFIYPGQDVRVMLTAYDFARYGSLSGRVNVIGADAIEDPQTGAVFYPVEVHINGGLVDASGQPLSVLPGMVADVSILSGKRTVLGYLVEPVLKVKDTAFRDR